MWKCPVCERNFKNDNQSHMCTTVTIDDLFVGRPESLLLAFDKILVGVINWNPCTAGTSTKTVVFTKEKAWLIVRPMSKTLDVKFYLGDRMQHPYIFKIQEYRGTYAHHIRIESESQIDDEFFRLLWMGFNYS